jgi:AcrR family transcriptional regulator
LTVPLPSSRFEMYTIDILSILTVYLSLEGESRSMQPKPEPTARAERERAARRADIVSAADEAFRVKGYHEASMDAIAEAAGFTKRTLYQYFETKEDLYFAVLADIFGGLAEAMATATRDRAPGLDKLEACFSCFLEFYRGDPRRMRLFSYVSQLVGRGSGAPHYAEWKKASDALIGSVADLIEEGRAAGSLRPELDGSRTAYSVVFLTTAFFSLLAVNGESFARSSGIDVEEFSRETMGLLTDALAARAPAGRRGPSPSSAARR